MIINHTEDYRAARARRYPVIGDQLDDMWRLLEILCAGDPALRVQLEQLPMYQAVKKVKNDIPKPGSTV